MSLSLLPLLLILLLPLLLLLFESSVSLRSSKIKANEWTIKAESERKQKEKKLISVLYLCAHLSFVSFSGELSSGPRGAPLCTFPVTRETGVGSKYSELALSCDDVACVIVDFDWYTFSPAKLTLRSSE